MFTRKLLEREGQAPQSFILVQKPYMERRAYATFKKQWPAMDVLVTSPQISYEEYPYAMKSKEEVINIIVGDLQRIKIYAQQGFQTPQKIPKKVWEAYEQLIKLGYTGHLAS